MRTIPLRLVLGIILVVAVILGVRLVACSGSNGSVDQPTVADPSYSDYTAQNSQVTLRGFYINEAASTEETAQVYLLFDLLGTENDQIIDTHGGTSFVRFLAVGDEANVSDVMTQEIAAAFASANCKVAAHGMDNSLASSTLSTKKATRVVALFSISRAALSSADDIYVWFDACNALKNDEGAKIEVENVVLTFPADTVRSLADESAIISKANH